MKERRGIQAKQDIGPTNIPGNPAPIKLPISALTIEPEIQQRARIDEALIAEYAESIKEWIDSAPIIVYSDGQTRWIADGFQRTEAARRAGLYAVPAIRIDGTRQDALRYALGANATHGRRRGREDLERAYRTAVREGFCRPTDTEAVASLLKCSARWASELTKEAREAAKVARDAEIQRLADEGKTQREIAKEVGVDAATVNRTVAKWKSSEMQHPAPTDPAPSTDHAQGGTDPAPVIVETEGVAKHHPVQTGDTTPEPVIVEAIDGDDLDAIRAATSKLQAEAETSPSAPASAAAGPAPAPATPAPKGPTAKDALKVMLQITGTLGALRAVEGALLESDARTLIKELRRALERLVERFERKEGADHA
ncbi:ParB N-terminal domain-containing protein [Allochromatium vinosum]|uniref:ParB N-terminal domain-containing protein n=1 Tax=Allochromatium vinosum TaxID=1049 RepID=UPI00190458C3|nr:helix-turn-helix domain-containing protein [Allochromatium vinosum]MBK1655363.1 hypothetical protein [Allochromatium vinosum]